RTPGADGDGRVRTPPDATDVTVDQQRAGPHARGPQLAPTYRVGHQQCTVRALQQEPGVAARQEANALAGGRGRTKALLVAGQDPAGPDRGANRRYLGREIAEGLVGASQPDACPIGEGRCVRRPEDMQVPSRELETSCSGVEGWRVNRPDDWRACAVPAHQ